MQYDEPLGLTIHREDATTLEAARIGAVEGVSNLARIAVIGTAIVLVYMLIPKEITGAIEAKIRRAL